MIGFDPRTLTKAQLAEAQALVNFIWEDSKTRHMLLAFAKDYIAAQHRLELTEAGAGIATEVALDILLTALTLGTGATLVVASKLRHLNKFRQIGLHLKKLAKALKQKAIFQHKPTQTGGQIDLALRKPDNQVVGGQVEDDINPSTLRQTGGGSYTSSADELYDAIRASETDVIRIASNTGIKPENIQKVKEHIFYNEHLLDKYIDYGIPAEIARFDSDLNQAKAWKRLENGTYTEADIIWLKHEIAERWYELKHNSGYTEAHNAAERKWTGNPWGEN